MLHAFNWSYNTIKENLPAIAAAGYTTVQTSPVQQPKDYSTSAAFTEVIAAKEDVRSADATTRLAIFFAFFIGKTSFQKIFDFIITNFTKKVYTLCYKFEGCFLCRLHG